MKRSSGILMHISSLPSPYGIGTFGRAAYDFVDQLVRAGQHYWQVLPLGPTSYGDSPYQSFSAFAGNPYFIDLDTLADEGLLDRDWIQSISWGNGTRQVDYGTIFVQRFPVASRGFFACQGKLGTHARARSFCGRKRGLAQRLRALHGAEGRKRRRRLGNWPYELRMRKNGR
jgi:4-alpha-glucanotransferase